MAEAKRVLVLSPTAELASAFLDPARKLALSITLGSADRDGQLQLDFSTRDAALTVVSHAQREPFAAVIAVADETGPVAARAASMLGLPFHTPKAADACRDKALLLRKLQAAGLAGSAPENCGGQGLEVALQCLMTQGRLRVLAGLHGANVITPAAFTSEFGTVASNVLRGIVPLLGLKHGPVTVTFSRRERQLIISNVSCAYVRPEGPVPRFSIPLVDQEVSWEELIVRNALDLDTSRVLLTGQER